MKAPTSMVAVLEPLIIPVPLGTVIKEEETGKIFCDLVNDGDTFVIAK